MNGTFAREPESSVELQPMKKAHPKTGVPGQLAVWGGKDATALP
jgi:hypothetical protein